jgi:hypothetical protein
VLRCILFVNDSSSHSDRALRSRVVDWATRRRRVRVASASPNCTFGSVAIDGGTASRVVVDRFDGQCTCVTPWTFDRVRHWGRSVEITGRRTVILLSLSAQFLRLWHRGESARPRLGIETPVTRFDVTVRVSGR